MDDGKGRFGYVYEVRKLAFKKGKTRPGQGILEFQTDSGLVKNLAHASHPSNRLHSDCLHSNGNKYW